MRTLITHAISLTCGILIALLFTMVPWISPSTFWLRQNGVEWFQFGPAIVSSSNCVRLDVVFGSFADRTSITNSAKIAAIKQWIIDNQLERRFRYSPTIPVDVGRDMLPSNAIYLFSSTDQDAVDSLILIIPINPLTTGATQQVCDEKIAELKKMLQ